MPEKVIDLNKSMYEICSKDPDAAALLAEAGFRDIVRPGMLLTAGKLLTVPKGAACKGISLKTVVEKFLRHGYKIRAGLS